MDVRKLPKLPGLAGSFLDKASCVNMYFCKTGSCFRRTLKARTEHLNSFVVSSFNQLTHLLIHGGNGGRWKFNGGSQMDGESIEQYDNILLRMAKPCGFCHCMHDSLIKDKIILGLRDKRIQDKIINQHGIHELDLKTCIDSCKAHESTLSQIRVMVGTGQVDRVVTQKQPKQGKNFNKKRKPPPKLLVLPKPNVSFAHSIIL